MAGTPGLKHLPEIIKRLNRAYPDARYELNFDNPLQLLVGTILAAQCTDVKVNQVTPALFKKYPNARAYADADVNELAQDLKQISFYNNKAKSIQGACKGLVEKHGGEVPRTMEELVQLPGVGRKTANVILGNAFGVPGITVDTHVGRLSRRLGLTENDDPVKVEFDLMAVIPERDWTIFSHRLIFHGRQVCHARKPNCGGCGLAKLCPKIGVASS